MTEERQKQLIAKAATWPERAVAVQITNGTEYEQSGELLKGIKALLNEADAVFDPVVKAAHEAHRKAIAAKRKVTGPLNEAESILKRIRTTYRQEQERIRMEEQRRLEAEARRLEEERRLAEAEALEAAGEIEAANAVLDAEPEPISIQAPPPDVPKVEGMAVRKLWKARVVDPLALVKHIAERPDLVYLIKEWNMAALNSMARSQHEMLRIPGVEVYSEESEAVSVS